ncbi:LOW QUALITY PROTEIN: histone-lysine N-methyltransferase KMT5C [Hippoglossus stenolepis]|uniref:LOW QUALITY PROTEIN: histone-lysine N-methyltransferase KMT5C n=1 Tax=Hippoglossus stenolepis TaxID=195615 RepID=UPI001FB02B4D|nr:LOW QUALITY PROTEIN: histone-lysine N-methyltransferase KMT5C [Hippoglossus stenolepis]
MARTTKMSMKELSDTDDLATCLVLDPLLGFKTHKMEISPLPKIPLESCDQLKEKLVKFQRTLDFNTTFEELGKLAGECFHSMGRHQQELLRQHISRYLKAFLLDSGVKIESCDRYTSEINGAKITSTRQWLQGQRVAVLVGCIARLTPDDEALLKEGVNDFSIIFSSRKHCPQLWLGPAAFINHDCSPNSKYVAGEGNVAYVEVIRQISPGEEFTCCYGASYFGEENETCECCTCESNGEGHFRKRDPPKPPTAQRKYRVSKMERAPLMKDAKRAAIVLELSALRQSSPEIPMVSSLDRTAPEELEKILEDYKKFRLGPRVGKKDLDNAHQASSHAHRFCLFMAAGLPMAITPAEKGVCANHDQEYDQ